MVKHFAFAALFLAACGTDAAPASAPDAPAASTPPPATTSAPPNAAPPPAGGDLRAGAGVATLVLPSGIPLAGYTGRRALVPDVDGKTPTKWFKASTGVRDAVRAHALVLESGGERVTFVSVDSVAILGSLVDAIVAKAREGGSKVDREHVVVFASHTHSGPGAITGLRFWEQAATDELVPAVRDAFVAGCADAVLAAEREMVPATAGLATGVLTTATTNRRAGVSKTFTPASIDPALAVLRVDRRDGTPLATLANFSIHPTALGASNTAMSADLVGAIVRRVEDATGAPALFAQGAEGDIAPAESGEAALDTLGKKVGDEIVTVRSTAQTKDAMALAVSNAEVDFGPAKLVLRPDGLSSGSLDLGLLGSLLGATGSGTKTVELGPDMVDHAFRFQAVRLGSDVIAAVPGEPIHTLGLRIKSAGTALGFGRVLVFGLANGHMSYVTDKDEYEAGGYEAAATFFGADTGDRLVEASVARLSALGSK